MSDPENRPVFYFDLGSPYAYLAAERVNQVLPVAPLWQPILLGAVIKAREYGSWGEGPDRESNIAEIERRASERGLLPLVWPRLFPTNTLAAMRVATYCKRIGKGQAFALAAFRQAFAGGRDLAETETLQIAAAACETSAEAVERAAGEQNIKDALRAATDEAIELGVTGVPTVAVGNELFFGDDRLEQAASALSK